MKNASTRALLVAATLGLLGASGVIHAQAGGAYPTDSPSMKGGAGAAVGAGGNMSESFDKLDRNKDGSITKREASGDPAVASAFATLDASKDGKLDLGEFAQFEAGGGTKLEGGTMK